jgi:mycoredoxin
MSENGIVVYGKHGCEDTLRARAVLDAANVRYTFHDVEADEARRGEAEELGRTTKVPVVVFADGAIEVEPPDEVVRAHL